MTAIQAFGPEAQRWSTRLRCLPAIVADQHDAARAFEAAVLARLAGDARYIAVQIDDPRAAIALGLGAAVLEQHAAIDARHALLDQVSAGTLPLSGGQSQQSLGTMAPGVLTTLRHVYEIADNLLVRSWCEYDRLVRLFGHGRPSVTRWAPPDPEVPPPLSGAGARDAIVIWGPRRMARDLGLLALAFDEMDTPVLVVSAGGASPALRNANFVAVADGPSALARALVIVDAELSDPGTALALAAYAVPVVTASTSGAHEFLNPSFVFDAANWRSVFRAVTDALGDGRAPKVSSDSDLEPPAPRIPEPAMPPRLPLVSVVTPTYNRRERVVECLRWWANQSYPNIEHVIVNDGGASISDLIAAYPRARVVDLPENVGIAVALNHGVEAALGTYLVLAADDDEYSSDHVLQLAVALERTGKSVAHTNTVIRHERIVDGIEMTVGYSLLWNTPLDRTTVLSGGVLALQSALIRRDAFIESGWYDPALPHGRDYGMISELAKRYDFVHVDTSTLIYGLRTDTSSERYKHRENEIIALRMIYERNPAPGRPAIAALRQHVLEQSTRVGSGMFNDPALPLPATPPKSN